jgi:hypothetical protein
MQRKQQVAKNGHGAPWNSTAIATLRKHSKARTQIDMISLDMERTQAALRTKAAALGIKLGQRRQHSN